MSLRPIAHVKKDQSGNWVEHKLDEHLLGVAELAGQFASVVGNRDWAHLAGLWHDLGKYSAEFQNYIRSASGYDTDAHIETQKGRVDHSTAGALYATKQHKAKGSVLAYLIAGHHAGLGDWENADEGRSQLSIRLRQTHLLEQALLQTPPPEILNQHEPTSKPPRGEALSPLAFSLWIRFLFACLVDADFLDTEEFMDKEKSEQRSKFPNLQQLQGKFDTRLEAICAAANDTKVNRMRRHILDWCLAAADENPGLFSLTVPTGGGKTLSSLAFALRHAIRYKKQRIIYVIPYTSIIEQTANILREIFGDCVIEHHSNFEPEKETAQSRLACENWDAPIVVTTNVQFFESLFAARTSKVRKLHRIADSVVILDEAQLLPPEFLQPILYALQEITSAYKTTVLICTATQPAIQEKPGSAHLIGLKSIREIVPDPNELHVELNRTTISLPADLNKGIEPQELATKLSAHRQILCILNRRDECRELHTAMPEGAIHLSGYMCGQHRAEVIRTIKEKLNNNLEVRVISTQLVEAGVDFDFPVVYRALSGIDSIAQAAGRCNREGRLERGNVFVFVSWRKAPRGHLSHMEAATREVLREPGNEILSPDSFEKYFSHLYWLKGSKQLDKFGIVEDLRQVDGYKIRFKSAARKFKLIDDSWQQSIFVRYENSPQLLAMFARGPDRWLLRKLQRYSVSIPKNLFKQLTQTGEIVEISPGYFAQAFDGLYDNTLGFVAENLEVFDAEKYIV